MWRSSEKPWEDSSEGVRSVGGGAPAAPKIYNLLLPDVNTQLGTLLASGAAQTQLLFNYLVSLTQSSPGKCLWRSRSQEQHRLGLQLLSLLVPSICWDIQRYIWRSYYWPILDIFVLGSLQSYMGCHRTLTKMVNWAWQELTRHQQESGLLLSHK